MAGNTSGNQNSANSGSAGNGNSGGAGAGSSGGSSSGGGGNNSGASTGGGSSGSGSSGAGASAGGSSSGVPSGSSGAGTSGSSSGVASSMEAGAPGTVNWPSAACQAQTAMLLSKMTRLQKAQQMVAGDNPSASDVGSNQLGSPFWGGSDNPPAGNSPTDWANLTDSYFQALANLSPYIPPINALDAVHGDNHPTGTVIFPHNVGMASSRDAALVTQEGQITAEESIATGINMTYAPMAGVAWDARWGRYYETFSDDATWAGEMVQAETLGLQGPNGLGSGNPSIIACSKHWAGDGQGTANTGLEPARGGVVDRSDIEVSLPVMESVGMAPYIPAINSGLGCVMVSDTTYNGTYITSDSMLITTLLKGMYGFKGFVITDWDANGPAGGIDPTINAGVDMLMVSANWQASVNSINHSTAIPDSRLNDAVTRILNVKCQAGLFSYKQHDSTLLANVGSAAHRAVARQAVAESLVVLQNNNKALPLTKGSNVWIGGSGANDLSRQCGGWTIDWQGNGGATQGTTISQAIGKVATIVSSMSAADAIVVVLSEPPYAETPGDVAHINSTIPASDFTTLTQAKAAGKPVVAIVMSGRPVIITSNIPDADAWIAAWLPGTEGDGVADVLFGTVHPTGKLSHNWASQDAMPNIMMTGYTPLFARGFGLTY
jgi:beta-glucosidase